jgi:uncharacterized OB-fold protein
LTSVRRALPIIDAETGFFWTAGKAGELQILRCCDCGRWQHPPLPSCPRCHGDNLKPQKTSGQGRVATFTINHEPWYPGMVVPFSFAAIELDEQAELYVFSNVLCPVDQVYIGMRVSVIFEQHEDVFLPLFQAVENADGKC